MRSVALLAIAMCGVGHGTYSPACTLQTPIDTLLQLAAGNSSPIDSTSCYAAVLTVDPKNAIAWSKLYEVRNDNLKHLYEVK